MVWEERTCIQSNAHKCIGVNWRRPGEANSTKYITHKHTHAHRHECVLHKRARKHDADYKRTHTYTHKHTHTRVHPYPHARTHTNTHKHTRMHARHTHTHAHARTHMRTHIQTLTRTPTHPHTAFTARGARPPASSLRDRRRVWYSAAPRRPGGGARTWRRGSAAAGGRTRSTRSMCLGAMHGGSSRRQSHGKTLSLSLSLFSLSSLSLYSLFSLSPSAGQQQSMCMHHACAVTACYADAALLRVTRRQVCSPHGCSIQLMCRLEDHLGCRGSSSAAGAEQGRKRGSGDGFQQCKGPRTYLTMLYIPK